MQVTEVQLAGLKMFLIELNTDPIYRIISIYRKVFFFSWSYLTQISSSLLPKQRLHYSNICNSTLGGKMFEVQKGAVNVGPAPLIIIIGVIIFRAIFVSHIITLTRPEREYDETTTPTMPGVWRPETRFSSKQINLIILCCYCW